MDISEFTIRLSVAAAAGLVIGFERRWNHKSAGLRTNTLVALGSAIFVILSINLTEEGGDVTRIIGQVVTGIGFLGAGIIFKEGTNIYGLTTAATIWCSSAVGCMAAAGLYLETLVGVAFIVFVNTLLKLFDNCLIDNMNKKGKADQLD